MKRAAAEALVRSWQDKQHKAREEVGRLKSDVSVLRQKIEEHSHKTNAGNLGIAAGSATAIVGASLGAPTAVVAGGAIAVAGSSYKPKRSGAGAQYQRDLDQVNQKLGIAKLALGYATAQLTAARAERDCLPAAESRSHSNLGVTVRMELFPRRRRRDE